MVELTQSTCAVTHSMSGGTMHRVLIVEDDPAEAAKLRSHLDRYAHEHDTPFSVEVLSSALEFVETRHVADLIFMDINMPGVNGMEAAELLRTYDSETPLVFVTDLAQYAVSGYRVDALDFMVKPVEYADFSLRMDRAMRVVQRRAGKSLTIPTADGLRVVGLRDVLYVDILRHDLYYHVTGGEVLRNRGSLTQLEEQLVPEGFVRVSASHLVNMAQVTRVRTGSVEMSDGEEISFGRSRKRQALETLSAYIGGSI